MTTAATTSVASRRLSMILDHVHCGSSGQHTLALQAKTAVTLDASAESPNTRTWRNWAHTASCVPTHWHAPESLAEIQAVLRYAAARGQRVRVVGTGHSPSALPATEGHMVSMHRMNRIIAVDVPRGLVKVEAGITLARLNDFLADVGLGLSVLGAISEQQLGGVVSTSTHGTGVRFGTMSTYVRSLDLVTADGTLLQCSRGRNSDVFLAALCGLGAVGVLVTVTLQCEPAFRLARETRSLAWRDMLHQWYPLLNSGDHANFWWYPYTGRVVFTCATRTQDAATESAAPGVLSRATSWVTGRLLGYHGLKAAYWASSWLPWLTPWINRSMHRLHHGGGSAPERVVDRSDRVFNFDCFFRQYVSEWSLPMHQMTTVLPKLRALVLQHGYAAAHCPVEIRPVRRDDVWLSPAYGRQSCYVGIITYKPYDSSPSYQAYFAAVGRLFTEHGGRPHWAKTYDWGPEQVRNAYPRYDAFMAVCQRLDEKGMFRNAMLDRVLGPT